MHADGFFGQYFENGQRWASKEPSAPLPSAVSIFWFLEILVGRSALQLSGTDVQALGCARRQRSIFFFQVIGEMRSMDALWMGV